MKKYFLILLAVMFAGGCAGSDKRQYEDYLMDCMCAAYKEAGIDLLQRLDDFEQQLIAKGVVSPNNKGESYYDYYLTLAEDGLTGELIDTEGFADLTTFITGLIDYAGCGIARAPSKRYVRLVDEINKVKSPEYLSIENAARAITKALSPADFDLPYYRAVALITICSLNTPSPFFPPPPPRTELPQGASEMNIRTGPGRELYLERVAVTLDELYGNVKDFIKAHAPDFCINLTNERSTTYEFYIEVQNMLTGVMAEL